MVTEINTPFAEVALVHISIYLYKMFIHERRSKAGSVKALIYKVIIFYYFIFLHFIIFKSCRPHEKQR